MADLAQRIADERPPLPARAVWGVRAYLMVAGMWVRVSFSYRTSFVLMTLAQFLVTGLDFLAILVMFTHVDTLGGFTVEEVAFLYGGAGLCLGIADLVLGNIERLGTKVRMGTFDAMMVRPVPLFAQLCADEFALRRLGRIAQAGAVFAWALTAVDVDWTAGRVLAVPYLVACGTVVFLGFFTLGAALQFWTQDAAEVANAFTYGGNTLAQYPLTIYPTEAVRLLTFAVPIAFVNWYPSLYVLGRSDPFGLPDWVRLAGPLAAAAVAGAAALAWRAGVRRYRSTGS